MSLSKAAVLSLAIACVFTVVVLVTVTVLMVQKRQCSVIRPHVSRLATRLSPGKVGVIMTTFGNNYVFAKQALLCFLRHVKQPLYILLYVNWSEDERLLNIGKELTEVQVIVLQKPATGGLTWTWNDGIPKCIEQRCNTIVLSNDDVIFDASIRHLLQACEVSDNNVYFGPLSNEPGNESNAAQLGTMPVNNNPFPCLYKGEAHNLNGFFMAFPVQSLVSNMFDSTHFFNPTYAFGGNETEWFERFRAKGGHGMVVPQAFVYHYKLKSWRKPHDSSICVYTINLGGYEGDRILLNNRDGQYNPADVLYFTDVDHMIYKCLSMNVQPFLIDVSRSNMSAKLQQRIIKATPHAFLPSFYHTSIYVDGNVKLLGRVQDLVDGAKKYALVCYQHWRRPARLAPELNIIVKENLASKASVDAVKSEMREANFDPNEFTLTETNMLVRKHHDIVDFSNDWARMIRICPRDQASFDFLLWKHNILYDRRAFTEKPVEKYNHVNPKHRLVA